MRTALSLRHLLFRKECIFIFLLIKGNKFFLERFVSCNSRQCFPKKRIFNKRIKKTIIFADLMKIVLVIQMKMRSSIKIITEKDESEVDRLMSIACANNIALQFMAVNFFIWIIARPHDFFAFVLALSRIEETLYDRKNTWSFDGIQPPTIP